MSGIKKFWDAFTEKRNSSFAQDYSSLSWGPIAAIVGGIGIYFAAQLMAGVFINIWFQLSGSGGMDIGDWFDQTTIAPFVLSLMVSLSGLAILFVFIKSRNAKISELGLVKPKIQDLYYAIAGIGTYIISYVVVASVLAAAIPALNVDQKQDTGFDTSSSGPMLVFIFIALVILPPLVEEIIVRGFIFSGLRKGLSFLRSAVITSVLFGLAHLMGGEGGSAIWIAVVDTFVLSMVMVYIRERSGSLWPSIGLHACKNLVAFLTLFILT